MKNTVVGNGFVSLINNRIGTIKLNGKYSFETLKMQIKILSSPYLTTNRIRIDTESDSDSIPEVIDIDLVKTNEPFINVEFDKLPFKRESTPVNMIHFHCDYDIELEVTVILKSKSNPLFFL